MDNPPDIKNDIEWMLYAQHYGIPTRLMDFTTSHIVSLLFAVEKSFHNEDDKEAVVYFLNPSKLNLLYAQQEQIINISSFPDIHPDGPIVIQGRKLNPRVNAQKGLFVLFQDDDKPLELINNEDILKKLVIAGSETKKNYRVYIQWVLVFHIFIQSYHP